MFSEAVKAASVGDVQAATSIRRLELRRLKHYLRSWSLTSEFENVFVAGCVAFLRRLKVTLCLFVICVGHSAKPLLSSRARGSHAALRPLVAVVHPPADSRHLVRRSLYWQPIRSIVRLHSFLVRGVVRSRGNIGLLLSCLGVL